MHRRAAGSIGVLPYTVLCVPHRAKELGSNPSVKLHYELEQDYMTVKMLHDKSRASVKGRLKYANIINDIFK